MTRLGSTFVSEDPDSRGQVGPAGNDSTVPGPAGEDSTVPGPAGEDGIVASVVAGANITVDNTDPANPIINASAGGVDPLTTKGDVFGFDTDAARIPVGANDEVLTADSTAALGVAWKTPASSGGDFFIRNTTTRSAFIFSGSSFASKGTTYDCKTNISMKMVQVPSDADSSATYKLVIAEVSGVTDVIDAITGTSATSGTSTSALPLRDFVFATPVALVAGKRYAFIFVRTDGTSTAISRPSFVTLPISFSHLEYVASVRYESNDPQVSDVTRFDTTNTVHMSFTYSVD